MPAWPSPPDEKKIRVAFGLAVRDLRAQAALTQEALADLAELSVSYVSLLERGQKTATLFAAARIAYVLDMSLPELLTQAEQRYLSPR